MRWRLPVSLFVKWREWWPAGTLGPLLLVVNGAALYRLALGICSFHRPRHGLSVSGNSGANGEYDFASFAVHDLALVYTQAFAGNRVVRRFDDLTVAAGLRH